MVPVSEDHTDWLRSVGVGTLLGVGADRTTTERRSREQRRFAGGKIKVWNDWMQMKWESLHTRVRGHPGVSYDANVASGQASRRMSSLHSSQDDGFACDEVDRYRRY